MDRRRRSPGPLAERTALALALADMARDGWRLDQDTVERMAAAEARQSRWVGAAVWLGALSLAAIAWSMVTGSY